MRELLIQAAQDLDPDDASTSSAAGAIGYAAGVLRAAAAAWPARDTAEHLELPSLAEIRHASDERSEALSAAYTAGFERGLDAGRRVDPDGWASGWMAGAYAGVRIAAERDGCSAGPDISPEGLRDLLAGGTPTHYYDESRGEWLGGPAPRPAPRPAPYSGPAPESPLADASTVTEQISVTPDPDAQA